MNITRKSNKMYCVTRGLVLCVLIMVSWEGTLACDQKFEGFGVFLGSTTHFSQSKPGTEAKVMEVIYDFLGIRYFRTAYEDVFSPAPNEYKIACGPDRTPICSWIELHKYVANLSDVKVFASIWSPPHHMKNDFYQLEPEFETDFFYFIKNITEIIKQDYNTTIERVSPVNEPENVFAPWDHTNMSPDQLCRIVKTFKDPLISVCPENSYFWVSKIYYNFESDEENLNCTEFCDIMATHAYALNLDFSSGNSMLAYYDMKTYENRGTSKPIWMTEVSSTYYYANANQMAEALDLATNILNFVGVTCVQRYYFWYAYTLGFSGESLIWGDDDGNLFYPKKFFVYKHFVNASNTNNGAVEVSTCSSFSNTTLDAPMIVENVGCIQFGDRDKILVNKEVDARQLDDISCSSLCCTTETADFECKENQLLNITLPPKSVCHCVLSIPNIMNNNVI